MLYTVENKTDNLGIEGLEPSRSIKPTDFPPTPIFIVVDIDM